MGETNQKSLRIEVEQEFEVADERGRSDMEQIKSELNEPDFILPSPANSREDVAFTNINVDERGEAFGIDNERGEPLNTVERIADRDEDRWSMQPESAEDFDKRDESKDD